MPSVETRLTKIEGSVLALEKQAEFFQNTVLTHIKDEGEETRRIFDQINASRKDMNDAVHRIGDNMSKCRDAIEEDMEKYYAKREHAITPTSLRNWMLFAIITLGGVISVTLYIVSK